MQISKKLTLFMQIKCKSEVNKHTFMQIKKTTPLCKQVKINHLYKKFKHSFMQIKKPSPFMQLSELNHTLYANATQKSGK